MSQQQTSSLDIWMEQTIGPSLSVLKAKGITLTSANYLGAGGYNIVFRNPSDDNSVIRIYWQSNIQECIESVGDTSTFTSSACINRITIEAGYTFGSPYYYMIVPKATPLYLITSSEMATALTRASATILDDAFASGFYYVDIKTSNFGKHDGAYKLTDIDFMRGDWAAICPRTYRRDEIDRALDYAFSIEMLDYSTLLYAFIVTLLRFSERQDGTYGGASFDAAQFVRVLKYVFGIRFMQEFIANESDYYNKFYRELTEEAWSEEEIQAAIVAHTRTQRQEEIYHLYRYCGSASGRLYLSSAIHQSIMESTLDLSEITYERVKEQIPKDDRGKPSFPVVNGTDLLYSSASSIFNDRPVYSLI